MLSKLFLKPSGSPFMKYLLGFISAIILFSGCETESPTPLITNDNQVVDNCQGIEYLALGDSYTIGQAVIEEKRWPNILSRWLVDGGTEVCRTRIIAQTGWTTGNLLEALSEQTIDTDYELVSLLIGVNNQYQGRSLEEYKSELRTLLDKSINYANGDTSAVFILSIPDYGYTPFGEYNQENISREIDMFNEAKKMIVEEYGIQFFYITDISRQGLQEPSLVAEDGLHPSGEQYELWVEKIISDQFFTDL